MAFGRQTIADVEKDGKRGRKAAGYADHGQLLFRATPPVTLDLLLDGRSPGSRIKRLPPAFP
jgi:hypothetical protein